MEISLPLIGALLLGVVVLMLYNTVSRKKNLDPSLLDSSSLNTADANAQLPDDSWEGSFSDAENAKALSINLEIDYLDGAGLESHRKIKVVEFDNDLHGGILIAHCYMRDAIRTFRFNRIQSCVNGDTGEAVEDLAGYLNTKYEQQTTVT